MTPLPGDILTKDDGRAPQRKPTLHSTTLQPFLLSHLPFPLSPVVAMASTYLPLHLSIFASLCSKSVSPSLLFLPRSLCPCLGIYFSIPLGLLFSLHL